MENKIKYGESLALFVENVILKYCPFMEDRLHILGNAKAPQIDIEIRIDNNQSQVIFLFGNGNFKQSIPEQVLIERSVKFDEIGSIIDFILKDHEVIGDINIYNNIVNLKFAINWTDKSIKDINCVDIELNLIFNNTKLGIQYLKLLFQKYYSYLVHIPSFKETKDGYINRVKQTYFNDLDKTQILYLLTQMSENELKELLYHMDNDTFIKYTTKNISYFEIKEATIKNK